MGRRTMNISRSTRREFGETATQEAIRELTRSLTEFEKDPKKLEAVRERIARALDARHSRR
jgi:chemotaxis methyl-accepting protein methylase